MLHGLGRGNRAYQEQSFLNLNTYASAARWFIAVYPYGWKAIGAGCPRNRRRPRKGEKIVFPQYELYFAQDVSQETAVYIRQISASHPGVYVDEPESEL
jgi:hypothetical protein